MLDGQRPELRHTSSRRPIAPSAVSNLGKSLEGICVMPRIEVADRVCQSLAHRLPTANPSRHASLIAEAIRQLLDEADFHDEASKRSAAIGKVQPQCAKAAKRLAARIVALLDFLRCPHRLVRVEGRALLHIINDPISLDIFEWLAGENCEHEGALEAKLEELSSFLSSSTRSQNADWPSCIWSAVPDGPVGSELLSRLGSLDHGQTGTNPGSGGLLNLARALRNLGILQSQTLKVVSAIWGQASYWSTVSRSRNQDLVLEVLSLSGTMQIGSPEWQANAAYVFERWHFPLHSVFSRIVQLATAVGDDQVWHDRL